jgi:hypothetical protein
MLKEGCKLKGSDMCVGAASDNSELNCAVHRLKIKDLENKSFMAINRGIKNHCRTVNNILGSNQNQV